MDGAYDNDGPTDDDGHDAGVGDVRDDAVRPKRGRQRTNVVQHVRQAGQGTDCTIQTLS